MPDWLRRPLAAPGRHDAVESLMGELRLNTVCREARCPNRGECYSDGTATFLVLGDACTRACRFCAVDAGTPAVPDAEEPSRVAEAVRRLGLRHAVITMVTRDDLADGGAAHLAAVVSAVRETSPDVAVEVLVSDLGGSHDSVDAVLDAGPDVFGHNLETVPRLYGEVRPGADYRRSLGVLARAAGHTLGLPVRSGLMLGLGETRDEVRDVMGDLREAGCGMLTLGQYLRPSPRHLAVSEFVPPDVFGELEADARALGFVAVASAPFVRSSYRASELVAAERGGGGPIGERRPGP